MGPDGNVYVREPTALMCVRKDVFLNLCELYPKTEEALKVLSLEKRKLYMHYLGEALNIGIRT